MNTTRQCAPEAREKAISPHFIIPLQPFLPPPPAPLAYPHLSLPCLWYVWPTKLQTHTHTHTHHLNMNTAVVWRRECEIVGEIAKMYQRYYHNVQICLPAFVFVVYNCLLVVCMCVCACVYERERKKESEDLFALLSVKWIHDLTLQWKLNRLGHRSKTIDLVQDFKCMYTYAHTQRPMLGGMDRTKKRKRMTERKRERTKDWIIVIESRHTGTN